MITSEQLEVLRREERHFAQMADSVKYKPAADSYRQTAAALAAAIATIERLPVDAKGVWILPGDLVQFTGYPNKYEEGRATLRGRGEYPITVDEWAMNVKPDEVEVVAAKGGGDA